MFPDCGVLNVCGSMIVVVLNRVPKHANSVQPSDVPFSVVLAKSMDNMYV